jgi:hypothetical protein
MPIRKMPEADLAPDRGLYSGLISLYFLHHATEEPIIDLGMMDELVRHGSTMNHQLLTMNVLWQANFHLSARACGSPIQPGIGCRALCQP